MPALSWPRLLLVFDLVMLGVGIPTALFAYETAHDLLPSFPDAFTLSWTPASVVFVCLLVGIAANLVFLLGPLTELGVIRWTRLRPSRIWRLLFAAVWLFVCLLGAAAVALTFFVMPIALLD